MAIIKFAIYRRIVLQGWWETHIQISVLIGVLSKMVCSQMIS